MSSTAPTPPATVRRSNPDGHMAGAFTLFQRQQQFFGISVADVREVAHARSISPVPQTPPEIGGVINLRGEILPVVMIDSWLGLPSQAFDPAKPVLIVKRKDLLLGIQVDAIERVTVIPPEEILPSPAAARNAIQSGIYYASAQKRLITLLDTSALLNALMEICQAA